MCIKCGVRLLKLHASLCILKQLAQVLPGRKNRVVYLDQLMAGVQIIPCTLHKAAES